MVQIDEIKIALPHPALPDADWCDCYSVTVANQFSDARSAGEAIIAAFPKWMRPLLNLREVIVTPLGLKHVVDETAGSELLGFFPVISESQKQLVAGMDDKHLKFCLVIDIEIIGDKQRVLLATLICKWFCRFTRQS